MALPKRWTQKTELEDTAEEIMELQMGPSHPATHGTIKFNLKLDGERIVDCDVEIGYLHRAFEKMCEQGTWTQVFPYTDRLNYASPVINNVAFALAVEKLLGVGVSGAGRIPRGGWGPGVALLRQSTSPGIAAVGVRGTALGFYAIE